MQGIADILNNNFTTMSITQIKYDGYIIDQKKLSNLENFIQRRAIKGIGMSAKEVKLLYELYIMEPGKDSSDDRKEEPNE